MPLARNVGKTHQLLLDCVVNSEELLTVQKITVCNETIADGSYRRSIGSLECVVRPPAPFARPIIVGLNADVTQDNVVPRPHPFRF
jgi:hypothetical protein